jgi:monofunctional biosynthetic peptidoglycan transglycosylase
MNRLIAYFGAALASLFLFVPELAETGKKMDTLIDFSDTDSVEWYVVNDGVMGGVSRSSLKRTGRGTAIFSGMLSLENNGGFASVRANVGRRDLSASTGLEIRIRGDGRTYQLRVRTDDRFDGIAYRTYFETLEGEWNTVRVPFSEFLPTFRGRILRSAPELDPSRVRQIGFLLADKKPGPFSLEIDFIRAWDRTAID